jgi:hypothetical protein
MVGKQLIRVRPYHAAGPEAAQVWHDRADCEIGRWIPSRYLRSGTRRLERCPECKRLEALDPTDPQVSRARAATERAAATRPRPTVEPVVPPDRRRPKFTTVLGVLACAAIVILAVLWQTGRLEPNQPSTTRASTAVAPTTVKGATAAKAIAKTKAAAVARALQALRAVHPPAAPAPTTAAPASAADTSDDTETAASYTVGSDGYTHGTESDGEACSDNPDDPQYPCAHMIPGSDGIGSPLPGAAATGGSAAASASGAAPAAHAQRRQARQGRTNAGK